MLQSSVFVSWISFDESQVYTMRYFKDKLYNSEISDENYISPRYSSAYKLARKSAAAIEWLKDVFAAHASISSSNNV